MAEPNEDRKITVSREFSVAAPQRERAYPIPASEWERLKTKISRIAPEQNWYQAGGWLSAGVAITTLISWLVSDNPLGSRATAIDWAVVIGGGLLAGILLFVDSQQRKGIAETAQSIVDDMSHIEKMFAAEGTPLSNDDKKQVFMARAWKAARSLYGPVGGGGSGPMFQGTDLLFNMSITRNGAVSKYALVVPANASPDEMESLVVAQIREADKRNNEPQPGNQK
jgi:hypothetical protein